VGSVSAFIMAIGLILTLRGMPVAGLKIGPAVLGPG
jgi:hypothetical protein